MRILHILPLIPLAAAEYGYWNFTAYVSFPASGYTSWGINAVYYNSELSEPIAVNCSYLYTPPTHNATESCTSEGFSYDLGGIRMANTISNVTLKQTVPLWGEQVTIMGSKAFKWDFSGGSGRYGDVNGTIEVTEAIA